ncbi:hypothetical protein BU225_20550, partial [Stenotrophomonas sp. MB339]
DRHRADDSVGRKRRGVGTLRAASGPPLPRDGQHPPERLGVRVRVRAATTQGTVGFGGWYRVPPSAGGRGWQMQSAQLRPTLY